MRDKAGFSRAGVSANRVGPQCGLSYRSRHALDLRRAAKPGVSKGGREADYRFGLAMKGTERGKQTFS